MCNDGITIYEVARENSIPIAESCGGEKICARCRIKILEGMGNLSRANFEEVELMKKKNFPVMKDLHAQLKFLVMLKSQLHIGEI